MNLSQNMDGIVILTIALVIPGNILHQFLA